MKKEFIVITILIFAILYFIREKKNQILARALIWKGVKETGTNAGFTNDIFQKMMKNVGWSSGSQWCAYFVDRKSTRLNSSHVSEFRMPSSA